MEKGSTLNPELSQTIMSPLVPQKTRPGSKYIDPQRPNLKIQVPSDGNQAST